MSGAMQGMISASSCDDVGGHYVAFSGDRASVCAVMTKKGPWKWNVDWRGRVEGVGEMYV